MFDIPTREEIQHLRHRYPPGTRIKLISMTDPQAVPPGTMGTIVYIDDMAQAIMKWDNGRTLSLVIGEDQFEVCHRVKSKKKEALR